MRGRSIRIVEFYLKNYAPFYESMGIHEFHFERRSSPNKIILILAGNGVGKTYLLAELSPEPLEHIAGRTSNRYIAGEEGEKRIHYIVDDSFEYVCHIIFSPDRKKTTCFITQIDLISGKKTELNPNGNVTSYMDIVGIHLQYSKTFKNIGYISADVKNIVTMSFTERQQLISTWLPDMSKFLNASKLVMKKLGQIKREIEDLSRDISKISLSDYTANLVNNQASLATKDEKLRFYRDHISKISVLLDTTYSHFSSESLRQKIDAFKPRYQAYEASYVKVNSSVAEFSQYLIPGGEAKLQERLSFLEISISTAKFTVDACNSDISRLSVSIESLKSDLSAESSATSENVETVRDAIAKLTAEKTESIRMIESALRDRPYFETVEYTEESKQAIKQCSFAMLTLNGYYTEIMKVIDGLSMQRVFETGETSLITTYETTMVNLRSANVSITESISNLEQKSFEIAHSKLDPSILRFVPSGCSERTCAFVAEVMKYTDVKSKSDAVLSDISTLRRQFADNETAIQNIVTKIEHIRFILREAEQINSLLHSVSESIAFLPDEIRSVVGSSDMCVFLEKIGWVFSEIRLLEEYLSIQEKISSTESSIHQLENVFKILVFKDKMSADLAAQMAKLATAESSRQQAATIVETSEREQCALTNLRSSIESLTATRNSVVVESQAVTATKNSLVSENVRVYEKSSLQTAISLFRSKEAELERDIASLKAEIEKCNAFITSRGTLEQRKDTLSAKQSAYELLYQIWNPRTGYPSIIIKDFLDEVVDITNRDLEDIWGGILTVSNFALSENEFRVPVIRGNTPLNDVCECSTAEKSTMALAISFGIIEVSTAANLYNIVRIDEADGGFDEMRRQSFLDMISNRLADMSCENAIIITHNQCFENTSCDVILLKDYSSVTTASSLVNKNVLYKYGGL